MLDLNSSQAMWLERMLDMQNMATSYKAFWLKGLMLEVIENTQLQQGQPLTLSFKLLVHRMIAEAWYPILQYRLNFGIQDQLAQVVHYINLTYVGAVDVPKNQLLAWLAGDTRMANDRVLQKKISDLHNMVPYRLINPFFSDQTKGIKDQAKNRLITELSQHSTEAFYCIHKESATLTIGGDWVAYIQKNQAVLLGWIHHKLTLYLQNKNRSVPNIIDKLEPPVARDLTAAKKYWRDAIGLLNARDLYTQLPLVDANYQDHGVMSIDHYVPWSFVLHDELWNLHPTFKDVNSAKGNRLPNLDETLDTYCKLQYDAFIAMRRAGGHKKALENYLSISERLNTIAILNPREHVDRGLFVNSLKSTIQPLYQIAYNMGFEVWRGVGAKESGFVGENESENGKYKTLEETYGVSKAAEGSGYMSIRR